MLKIPAPGYEVHAAGVISTGNSQSPALTERSRFQTKAKFPKIFLTIFPLRTVSHGLKKFLLGHSSTVIGDPDPGILTIKLHTNVDLCGLCLNRIIHYVGHSGCEIITYISQRLDEPSGGWDNFIDFYSLWHILTEQDTIMRSTNLSGTRAPP